MLTIENLEKDLNVLIDTPDGDVSLLLKKAEEIQEKYSDFVKVNKDSSFALIVSLFKQKKMLATETLARLLRKHYPNDVRTIHLLASLASEAGQYEDAVSFLLACLDIQPDLALFHYDLAHALFNAANYKPALKQCDLLLKQSPDHLGTASLKAAVQVKLGLFKEAADLYKTLVSKNPDNETLLLRYGVTLRILGESQKAINIFKRALTINPKASEAYWNLANLKTYIYSDSEIEEMKELAKNTDLSSDNKAHLFFALGVAFDKLKNYQEAFEYFTKANAIYKKQHNYDYKENIKNTNRQIKTFTQKFVKKNQNVGCKNLDPIFILGLPRSGSTLLEQIISSHSQVDATMELSEITSMVRSLDKAEHYNKRLGYPEILSVLMPSELENFGTEYIKRTQIYRENAKYFIDKTPHNFMHIGLILSILPNAKIIDARRDPIACGFSIYKQQFARGHRFSNDLFDIGQYYSNYLKLMQHWNTVYPGKILTVNYEEVIADTESQVKRILDYCNLDFEEECLTFYKSNRAVATVSSEQVRQPIYKSALNEWENYSAFLDPLKKGLSHVE